MTEYGAFLDSSPGAFALIAACGLGYFLGAIPFAAIAARLRGLGDLRRIGSGNIGATNVLRTGDRTAAALALGGDALKGAAAVLLGGLCAGQSGAQLGGFAAVIGHIFPVFLGFHGGKGVATCAGAIFAAYWPAGLCLLVVWAGAAAATRYSSVGALASAAAAPAVLWAFGQSGLLLFGATLAATIWITHARNIGRLRRGEESRIGAKP